MKIPRLIITREHGSWAVLVVPMAVGITVARQYSLSELLLLFTALSAFMAYVPLQTLLRHRFVRPQNDEKLHQSKFWALAFGCLGFVSGFLLVVSGFPLLLLFGALGTISFFANFLLTRYFQKTIAGDLVAVAGLTLGAPSMYYVAIGRLDASAFSLWTLNVLFFGSSVFYVHMKMRASGLKKMGLTLVEKLSIGKLNIIYHLSALVIVGVLALIHFTPPLAVIAFVPMTIHAIIGTIRLSGNNRYKVLGYLLLGQSVLFGLILTLVETH
jgi:hypothetical protein